MSTEQQSRAEPRRFVRLFKPQFAPLVEAGVKCQTVRPWPKRLPGAGDRISLRAWTGKPYRSKQRVLREARVTGIANISIWPKAQMLSIVQGVSCNVLREAEADGFAQADGFRDAQEMFAWFAREHGEGDFAGIVIYWSNNPS